MAYDLKPFVINTNDLVYLLAQVNFQPLFDGAGNAVVDWDGTSPVFDAKNNPIDLTGLSQAQAWAAYGHGFPSVAAPIGIRDITGYHNNLFGTQADWGAVDAPFVRSVGADYSNYLTQGGTAKVSINPDTLDLTVAYTNGNPSVTIAHAVYAPALTVTSDITKITLNAEATSVIFTHATGPATVVSLTSVAELDGQVIAPNYTTIVGANGAVFQASVVDSAPRMISNTITTGGVNLLLDGNGNYVVWDPAKYISDTVYAGVINNSQVDISKLIEGAKIVAPILPTDYSIVWDSAAYSSSNFYRNGLNTLAGTLGNGDLYGSETGGTPIDGGTLFYYNGTTYEPLKVGNVNVLFDAGLYVYRSLIDAIDAADASFTIGTLSNGDVITVPVSFVPPVVGDVSSAPYLTSSQSGSGYGLLETLGQIDYQNPNSGEFFIGSENPGVSPVNSWFAIFGQFFDHGLDKLAAGGQGTKITIALDPTDPLYGTTGSDGQPVTSITVTRATVTGADANGDPTYANHTSPFIDQSQTYGSHEQLTDLLREWVSTDGGATYHAGMKLFDGTTLADTWTRRWPDGSTSEVRDTLPTLTELRAHLVATGRDDLSWADVLDLRNRDANGDVATGTDAGNSGSPLLLDMNPHFDSTHVSATALSALNSALLLIGTTQFTATSLSFGGLIAVGLVNPATNLVNPALPQALQNAVSEVLLESVGDHYIAGDGRVNENFGLTSIHHVFHEEHNYQVENLKTWIYAHDTNSSPTTHDGLHEWQIATASQDVQGNYLNQDGSVAWDPDKMFNATKLIVEMEYQHAAVDQYARTITPRIQEFVGYSSSVDSTITLEYAQVAFRFGHSTIRETIDTIDPSGWFKGAVTTYALEKAFLAPQTFAEEGAASIVLGLSRQQMNEVDEFITPALNQGLLGQPLDLAAINIARSRDMGIPTLNDFREAISLARYTSWADFGANMIHPESLVNFMAAYSFGGLAAGVALAQEILDLVDGVITVGANFTAAEALAFINNNISGNAVLDAARSGFDHIDSWIGGLAEAHVPGGLLGETFDAVFVAQIQSLMDGDRFYYLYRLFGTQIAEEVNNGQFKDLVERNTGLEHLNGSIFAYADKYYQFTDEAVSDSKTEHSYATELAANPTLGMYSDGGATMANNGTIITIDGQNYIRDIRPELDPTQVHPVEGTPVSGADSHEVIVGTDNKDYIHARGGDDTVYGDGGDDIIFGDGGIDRLYGGAGNDYLDAGEGPDLVDGGAGKDTIYGRGSGSEVGGFDQLVGGSGNDLIIGGEGIDKLSAGAGDDIVFGDGLTNPEMGNTDPFTHGGDGNDYIDGGASGDLIYGEEGDDYIVGGADQDLMQGGQGDDIIRPGAPSQAIGGGPDEVIGDDGYTNYGFDLVDFSDYAAGGPGITISLINQTNPLVAIDGTTPIPAMAQIEGIIGSSNDDTLSGENVADPLTAVEEENNWLIGGSGNDSMFGGAGNDLIVGGSVRLDTLVGKYTGATGMGGFEQLGGADWIADAMLTGGAGTGYNNNTEDAYTGASNRATGDISGGFLAGVNSTIVGTANDFELHFTEMLRSRMFKDVVLGDGGTDGTADMAVFSGNLGQYTMVAYDINGAVVANPHLNGFYSIKITDNRTAADLLDVGGNPILDANGDPITLDGTDLIIGVEKFKFADQTINPAAYFDAAPVVDLRFATTIASDNFSGNTNAYSRGTGWGGIWSESGDSNNNPSSSGQILVDSVGSGQNNNSGLHITGGSGINFDGASISRAVNLASYSNATLSFSVQQAGISGSETVKVYLQTNAPTNLDTPLYTIQTGNDSTLTTHDISLNGPFLAGTRLYFVSSAMNATTDDVYIDNIVISAIAVTDGSPGINNAATYTELQLAPVFLTSSPQVTDPDSNDTNIASATITISDAIAGDVLNIVGSLPNGIGASGVGTTQILLTGVTSHANYQLALKAITFSNMGQDPTNHGNSPTRHINVTVNDGLKDSAIATTTVTMTGVDNLATDLAADSIITNYGLNQTITVPDWALVANDTDVDGAIITGVSTAISLSSPQHSNGSVTVRDTGSAGGTFSYASGALSATVTITQDIQGSLGGTDNTEIIVANGQDTTINALGGNDIIFAGGGNDTVNAGDGNDTVYGNTDDDIINAGNGDDTIVWSNGDGTDIVDGGASTAGIGDRFVLNGGNQAETFRILSITDPNNDAEIDTLLNGLNNGDGYVLDPLSTILIVRIQGNNTSIVAELRNIEEITINNQTVTTGGGNTAGQGTDTVQIVGDFSATGLALNTITINGSAGDDTVDISRLTSSHRIVFNSGTGNDHVVGDTRPQDVVNFGSTATSGTGGGSNGNSTGNSGSTGQPGANAGGSHDSTDQPGANPGNSGSGSDGDDEDTNHAGGNNSGGSVDDDGEDDADTHHTSGGNHDEHDDEDEDEDDDNASHPSSAPAAAAVAGLTLLGDGTSHLLTGNGGDDVAVGSAAGELISTGDGADFISAGAGDDTVVAGGGNDTLFGEDGNDHIFGGDGNDLINAGNGGDDVFGGAGNDTFVARAADGIDSYYGDAGSDTLDMSAITAKIEANLGTGNVGWAMAGGVTDTLYAIENIVTGAGDDTITASSAHNVIDTGAGTDTIVFRSASDADGDTILNFEAGDKIDVSDFMAGTVNLVANSHTAAAGQIAFSFDTISGESFTVLHGTDGSGNHFEVDIKGHHNLTVSDFAA